MSRKNDPNNPPTKKRGNYANVQPADKATTEIPLITSDYAPMLLDDIAHILEKEACYVRIGRSSNGDYWARLKWTGEGSLAGYYTFGSASSLLSALCALLENVEAVYNGTRKAHKDNPYKG